MAGSLKFLQLFQKFHEIIGISQRPFSIKSRKTIFLICNAQFELTTIAFLVLEAKSMFDYGFGFFVGIYIINDVINYLLLNWKFGNTLKLIENCKKFIGESK